MELSRDLGISVIVASEVDSFRRGCSLSQPFVLRWDVLRRFSPPVDFLSCNVKMAPFLHMLHYTASFATVLAWASLQTQNACFPCQPGGASIRAAFLDAQSPKGTSSAGTLRNNPTKSASKSHHAKDTLRLAAVYAWSLQDQMTSRLGVCSSCRPVRWFPAWLVGHAKGNFGLLIFQP